MDRLLAAAAKCVLGGFPWIPLRVKRFCFCVSDLRKATFTVSWISMAYSGLMWWTGSLWWYCERMTRGTLGDVLYYSFYVYNFWYFMVFFGAALMLTSIWTVLTEDHDAAHPVRIRPARAHYQFIPFASHTSYDSVSDTENVVVRVYIVQVLVCVFLSVLHTSADFVQYFSVPEDERCYMGASKEQRNEYKGPFSLYLVLLRTIVDVIFGLYFCVVVNSYALSEPYPVGSSVSAHITGSHEEL